MRTRRIVGIDLGIASTHTVVVIDETAEVLARRRCRPAIESLAKIEAAALSGATEGTQLEVIIEPTGAAWLPVAVFFSRRGHVVHRVSSAKAAALRRFLSQHAKSNSIDAETLAPPGHHRPGRPPATLAGRRRGGQFGSAGAGRRPAHRDDNPPQGPHPGTGPPGHAHAR